MAKNHLKSVTAPKTWPVKRKESVFIKRPLPGGHRFDASIPLSFLLTEMTRTTQRMRGVKYLLNEQELLVNGKRRRRPDDTAGLFDVVSLPAAKTSYRVTLNDRNRLVAFPVGGKDAELDPCRVKSKTKLKSGTLQVGCHNGRVFLLNEKEAPKVGDSLFVTNDNKVETRVAFATGAFVFLTGGKHVGKTGTVTKIAEGKVIVKTKDGEVETRKAYAFPVGEKEKPIVKVTP